MSGPAERKMRVALVHDYLTQRGGAERVLLAIARAFPEAPVYTSLYNAATTFPEFAKLDVRTLPLQAVAPLRSRHRHAMPLLARAFSTFRVDADVVICSSSGWSHAVDAGDARKIVYCYSPPKWLYRTNDYLGAGGTIARAALAAMRPYLLRHDQRAAASAHAYLAISSYIAHQIFEVYGKEAEVVIPPVTFRVDGALAPVAGVEAGFFLVVSRLLPYKRVDAVASAFREMPAERLVIVGDGPAVKSVSAAAGANVTWISSCSDAELRWLYASCRGLITASREDLGLTPLEAALFGKPAAVLRWGGFLDTVVEGVTGVFFNQASSVAIVQAVRSLRGQEWDSAAIAGHARTFSEDAFASRLREIVNRGDDARERSPAGMKATA